MKLYSVYKDKISGLQDVADTVKTVEKVAASSVHLMRGQVAALNFHAQQIEQALRRLSALGIVIDHPMAKPLAAGKSLLLVLTGDKGLVGGLWHNLVNEYIVHAADYDGVIVVGAKGLSYLEEEGVKVDSSFTDLPEDWGSVASRIKQGIFSRFGRGDIRRIDILLPRFLSLGQQLPAILPFLPFSFVVSSDERVASGLPIYEPSAREAYSFLLEEYIGVYFYGLFLETRLSELSARTISMETAAAKTEELERRLELEYIKERNRSVTRKQLESFMVHKMV